MYISLVSVIFYPSMHGILKIIHFKILKQQNWNINFIVTPCIDNIQHFNFQLMHTKLKKLRVTEHCVMVYPHTVLGKHASHVTICSHSTDNVFHELYVSTLNQMCNFSQVLTVAGVRGSVVVRALQYKPAGRGFYSRWCHWNFSVT